ncbi:hypothetical protein BDN70DRAFT_902100 [Pholiota conissans]|uniref:Uncharacterized protein n=1 Tax=Pholiota conissans TaxID=109636 RepID=A0A9P5YMC0_9AGAR|nr:hypothetical protein BDN70DRAFT_902100 [Pholiota conissans]
MSFPNLVPVSTQSDASSSMLAISSLDVIVATPQAVAAFNSSSSRDERSLPENSETLQQNLRRFEAMWHADAGLIASPNVSYLPKNVPRDLEDRTDDRVHSQPKLLTDDEVYLAFRPRFARNGGALFGRLNLTREALATYIRPLRNGKSILTDSLIIEWTRLEESLLDVVDCLLSATKAIPKIVFPKLPWEYGYRHPHGSQDVTLRCAIRSRDAFMDLSAVVSFALSLHMDHNGKLGHAFLLVRQQSTYKPERAWFDLLSQSYVCNFSPHFRVGGFLNPYTSRWMGYIPKFIQANAPIWVFWGHFHKITFPLDNAAFKYSPPDSIIEGAKARAGVTSTLVLPIYRYDPFSMSHGVSLSGTSGTDGDDPMGTNDPDWEMPPSPTTKESTPPPPPEMLPDHKSDTARKAMAVLEEYFESMERARELRLSIELPREKQQRESWEQFAKTHYTYTSASKIYEWRKQDDGSYERVKLDSTDYSSWVNYTRNQKRFVGHENAWELCPQLPRYSEEHPREAEPYTEARSDYESDGVGDSIPGDSELPSASNDPSSTHPYERERPNDNLYIDDLRALASNEIGVHDGELITSRIETFDFASFVKGRFGYDIFSPEGWTTDISPSARAEDLSLKKVQLALSFDNIPAGNDVGDSIINLVRTLSNQTWTFSNLPSAFDHSDDKRLSLVSDTVQVVIVLTGNSTKYILYKKGYIDRCPWGIYVSDASTILLIFRNQWRTMDLIARELVARGVPFHTVVASEAAPLYARPTPVRGLGERPSLYVPTLEDYNEYLRRRRNLLMGSKGRAALMHGGIVARIARDVLDQSTILDGPSTSAVTVGKHQRFNLYDDELDENELDIICGVYYVDVESPPVNGKTTDADGNFQAGLKSHMSYWPKDSTWQNAGAFLRMEWTEKAETFYQKNLARLQRKPQLLNSGGWKRALRVQNTLTREIEIGAEHYQAGYVEHCLRQTRFVDCGPSLILNVIVHLHFFALFLSIFEQQEEQFPANFAQEVRCRGHLTSVLQFTGLFFLLFEY